MISTLVKAVSAVVIATCIMSLIGVTYAIYHDQNMNVDASVTSWNEKSSTIGLKIIIKNKMAEDLKIIKISYKVYGDKAKTKLLCEGTINQYTVPGSQTVSKTITIKLLSFDQKSPKILIDATVDYQLGKNPPAQLVITKIINIKALIGSGNLP